MAITHNILAAPGTSVRIMFPLQKRSVQDFAVGADWTPVAGDVAISVDGGSAVNTINLPVAVDCGRSAIWYLDLNGDEISGIKRAAVMISDAPAKAIEDTCLSITTAGISSPGVAGIDAVPFSGFTGGVIADMASIGGSGELVTALQNLLGDYGGSGWPVGTAFADALLDRANGVETGLNFRQWLRLGAATLFGKASGLPTAPKFRDFNDTKDRISATTDANGNRSAVTRDAS